MAAPFSPQAPRFVLAGVVFLICGIGAAATATMGSTGWLIAFCVVGALALIDIVVIALRKGHGEPG